MSTQDAAPGIRLPLTRRATLALGGTFAAVSGFVAGLGLLAAEAKKKKGKKKGKKNKNKKKVFLKLAAPEMTGANEVPDGSGDALGEGSGECTIFKKGKKFQICCEFAFSSTSPNSEVVGFHIHEGPPTEDGPIVIDLEGDLDNCVSLSQALAAEIKDDPSDFYANIHTEDFPDGAVRDQLVEIAKG